MEKLIKEGLFCCGEKPRMGEIMELDKHGNYVTVRYLACPKCHRVVEEVDLRKLLEKWGTPLLKK